MKNLTSPIDFVKKNNLIINKKYSEFLVKIGFDSFDPIYGFNNGEIVKKIKNKMVIRIECKHETRKYTFYLKRHSLEYIGLFGMFSSFFLKRPKTQGCLEYNNICEFREKNFPTVIPVAAGERVYRLLWAKSFLITEDFSPYISLEDMLEHQPDFFTSPEGVHRKRILLGEISRLARNMHQQGLNHLDFNATHILLHYENGSLTPRIALFDFQRVTKRRFLRLRWKIKSLARLNYSLPAEIFTEKDRIYLFLSYLKKDKLQFIDRLQWVWFKRKTARIKHHTDKILARRKRMNK